MVRLARSCHTLKQNGSNGYWTMRTLRICSIAADARTGSNAPRKTSPRRPDVASAPKIAGTWSTATSRSSRRARSPCMLTPTSASTKTDASKTATSRSHESVRFAVSSYGLGRRHACEPVGAFGGHAQCYFRDQLRGCAQLSIPNELGSQVFLQAHTGRSSPCPVDAMDRLRYVPDLHGGHSATLALAAPLCMRYFRLPQTALPELAVRQSGHSHSRPQASLRRRPPCETLATPFRPASGRGGAGAGGPITAVQDVPIDAIRYCYCC